MSYVTQPDFLPYIRDTRLTQMIDADTSVLDDAAQTAVAMVQDSLSAWYDTAAIFGLSGDARHKQVVRWVVCIALYILHQRLPDRLTPERVSKDYDGTLETLKELENGSKQTMLPRKTVAAGTNTKFKWGSKTARTH